MQALVNVTVFYILFIMLQLSTSSPSQGEKYYTIRAVNGFLKAYNMGEKAEIGMISYKCMASDETYTAISYNVYEVTFSNLCKNDPGFYQNCGLFDLNELDIDDTQVVKSALCGLPICSFTDFIFGDQVISGTYHHTRWHCNPNFKCNNFNNTENCPGEWYWCHSSDQVIPVSKKCDGILDCPVWSEDETGCGHSFGLECLNNQLGVNRMKWKKPHNVCINSTDGDTSDCDNEIDLIGSERCGESDKVGRCMSSENTEIDFYEVQRCGTQVLPSDDSVVCIDGSDHINCTNRDVFFNCTDSKFNYTITLTDVVLCENLNLCSDDLINKCESPERSCRLHRHFVCDGVQHCKNGQDESFCTDKKTGLKCTRVVRNKRLGEFELHVLKDWVLDGVQDCENGMDEDPKYWKLCTYEISGNESISRFSFKPSSYPCNFTFICNDNPDSLQFLEPTEMCNGQRKPSCEIEGQLCKIARGKNVSVRALALTRTKKYLSSCLPSTQNEGVVTNCKDYIFDDSYGTKPIIIVGPDEGTLDCRDLFGESYVYAACLSLCINHQVKCPVADIHFTRSCPYLPNRIMTLTKRNTLTFVEQTDKEGEFVNQEIFPCSNGNCIPYTQVCDLVNDCGDNSDEDDCENHFSCSAHKTEIIKYSQFCDGFVDCSDATDECSPECHNHEKKILTSAALQSFGWLVSIPATILNMFMIVRNIAHLTKEKKKVNFCIDAFVTLIALGDFCVALYLLCICFENMMMGNEFCKRELEWLTSVSCGFYGVLSTFGSQLSVFGITVLSLYRSYVIREVRISVQRSYPSFVMKVVFTCALIMGVSLFIAITPTNVSLRNAYFYNGYYIENAPLFLGSKRNNDFIPILEKYFGVDDTMPTDSAYGMRNKIKEMFRNSDDPEGTEIKFNVLGFYGSSGLCTFKYFVDPHDPQQHFTWTIIGINFLCFIIISIAYCSVQVKAVQSSNRVGHVAANRFGPLQRKITMIIFTDFLCKFPFILVCFVHYTRILDATGLYPGFSTILLPINTVINPILYDKYLTTLPSWIFNSFANLTRLRQITMSDARQTMNTSNDFNGVATRNPVVTQNVNDGDFEMQCWENTNS